MSRELRIEFPDAIYHVTSRGDRCQDIVLDDADRNRLFERIGRTVEKYAWRMFATAIMTNHLHLFFQTPQPNLSRGMQFLLGGYASWWNHRHERAGHVFQGRFRGYLVEDESYFWAVSRYVHLNPVPVLVPRPEQWKWSSYAGYVDATCRVSWIDYDAVLQAWHGAYGAVDPTAEYQQYVESRLDNPRCSPFGQAIDGWILGNESFAERVRTLISPSNCQPRAVTARRVMPLRREELVTALCGTLQIEPSVLSSRGTRHPARALFAYLGHRYTDATLSQLAVQLGLSRPDSVTAQIRRVTRAPAISELRRQLDLVQKALGINAQSG